MFLSIIIPNHNYEKYLKFCIKSIFKNNDKFIKEIIIVNDSCSDSSSIISETLKKESSKVKTYNVNFKSLSKTMNYGINKATGDYILKLDADDYIAEDFIQKYMTILLDESLDLVFGNIIKIEDLKENEYIIQSNSKFLYMFFYPIGSGIIYKKSLWEKVKGYNEYIKYQDDLDFWIKLKKIPLLKIFKSTEYLYFYRMHPDNMSKNFIKKYYTKLKILIHNTFNFFY